MTPEIRNGPFSVALMGAAKQHDPAKSYGEELLALLDRVWAAIRQHKAQHGGINHVLYGATDEVFAGVEVFGIDSTTLGLEQRQFHVGRHAFVKHIGPYSLLGTAHASVKKALADAGLMHAHPIFEIYGHWNQDESKLETDLIYPIIE